MNGRILPEAQPQPTGCTRDARRKYLGRSWCVSASESQMKKLSPCWDQASTSGSLPSISASFRGKVLPLCPPLPTLPVADAAAAPPPAPAPEGEYEAVAPAAAALQEALRLRRDELRVMVVAALGGGGSLLSCGVRWARRGNGSCGPWLMRDRRVRPGRRALMARVG